MLSMPNIQPGKGRSARAVSQPVRQSGSGLGAKIAVVFKVAFFVAVFAGIINGYIFLNQKIVETDRKIASGNKEIHNIEREIGNLRIHREELRKWSHVSRMMKVFNLDLRLPQSGQICKLTVLSVEQAAMVPFSYTPPQYAEAVRVIPAQGKRPVQIVAHTESLQKKTEKTVAPKRTAAVRKNAVQAQPELHPSARRPIVRQNNGGRKTAQTRNGYVLFDAR